MSRAARTHQSASVIRVDVHETEVRTRSGWISCKIGEHLRFSTESLSAYFFTKWHPEVFDALLVAAAVEFCDRSQGRSLHHWARTFNVRIPVHSPSLWNQASVSEKVHDALCFLTGDNWCLEFVARKKRQPLPRQSTFELPHTSCAVIAFSDGMDSRAVAGLVSKDLGDRLVRIRLGTKSNDAEALPRYGQSFTTVPYSVRLPFRAGDSSARSRGFKFATVSGLSAYLAAASQIVVPESGQGALGPALIPVGQAYPDYRNHPLFTDKMEAYLEALLGYRPRFQFPRLWHTKGETLKAFKEQCEDGHAWAATRSCWQGARQVSVHGSRRQCGICAACMLRRLSVHAAGLREHEETYVWESLQAPTFEKGAAPGFQRITGKLRHYAIAGALHLDHLATIRSTTSGRSAIATAAFHLGRSRNMLEVDAREKLDALLLKHESEWKNFLESLGTHSFVAHWTASAR